MTQQTGKIEATFECALELVTGPKHKPTILHRIICPEVRENICTQVEFWRDCPSLVHVYWLLSLNVKLARWPLFVMWGSVDE